jgi:dihydroorotate dehydrogenase electron transfer subunit
MQICKLLANQRLHHDYFTAVFEIPDAAKTARPGQFIHLQIDTRQDHILRRPFSICDTDPEKGTLTIVYKVVGAGTSILSKLTPGEECDIMAPLGTAFSAPESDVVPIAVAGGYGAAATFMLTRYSKEGMLLIGARNEKDLLLCEKYNNASWQTAVATDDGSKGTKGNVLVLLDHAIETYKGRKLRFYGCGPKPMLFALAKELRKRNLDGELSVDQEMCCGIGACFACVVRVNDCTNEKGWRYARSCSEGPVFKLDEIYTGE